MIPYSSLLGATIASRLFEFSPPGVSSFFLSTSKRAGAKWWLHATAAYGICSKPGKGGDGAPIAVMVIAMCSLHLDTLLFSILSL